MRRSSRRRKQPLEDLELFDVKFPKGIQINVIIGSANRDETHLGNADRLRLARPG